MTSLTQNSQPSGHQTNHICAWQVHAQRSESNQRKPREVNQHHAQQGMTADRVATLEVQFGGFVLGYN